MVPSSQTAANEALPDQLLTLPHETSNTTLHPQSQDARFQPDLTDTGAAEWLSSAHKPRSGELPVRPFSSRAHLAGPLMLQSSFAAQYYTQGVWDFGIEQLLLQDSFWDQLLSLLQVCPCKYYWAVPMHAVLGCAVLSMLCFACIHAMLCHAEQCCALLCLLRSFLVTYSEHLWQCSHGGHCRCQATSSGCLDLAEIVYFTYYGIFPMPMMKNQMQLYPASHLHRAGCSSASTGHMGCHWGVAASSHC